MNAKTLVPVTVLGGRRDGQVVTFTATELLELRHVTECGQLYEIAAEQQPTGDYELVFVADGAPARRRPRRRLWPRDVDLLKPAYLTLLRLGLGLGDATEAIDLPYPVLLDEPGVGPIVAADVIVAWSHAGRVRSEAAFARLAGVAPVPASSGHTVRHRLSRGGDRQLNRALHTVVLHRRHHDPATRVHRATRLRRQESSRGNASSRALSRPPPLPPAATNGAADDLTGHR